MALKTQKCLECEKEFGFGEWACAATGANHVVEAKSYFMDDAPTVQHREGNVMVTDKHSTTTVLNIPPERQIKVGNDVQRTPGGAVTFVRGRYDTADPEIQFYLDRKPGLCTKARWEAVYFSETEKQEMKRMELDARERRLEMQEGSLLAKVQKQAQKGA